MTVPNKIQANWRREVKRNFSFLLIALSSIVLFSLLQLLDPPIVRDHLESKTFDLRLRLRNALQGEIPRRDIVIVEVDEESLAAIGRWPWSREVMGRLVRIVSRGQPKVVGIDIMFSERESLQADQALGEAVARAGNVVLAAAFAGPGEETRQATSEVPEFLWDSAFMQVVAPPGIPWKQWAVKPAKIIPPIAEIASGALVGHVTMYPDSDGVLRWELLFVNFEDDCYPSLALQVARMAAGLPMESLTLYPGSGVKFGDRLIPTDLSGRVIIDYFAKERSFPRLSAADLLLGRVDPAVLRDATVLVGTSAMATYDQKVTPVSADMAGVEKNAFVVQNILSGGFIAKSPGIMELIVILATGLLLALVLPRQKAKKGVLLGFGLMAFYILFSCFMLASQKIWVNLFYPLSNLGVIVAAETIAKLFSEERKAKKIREMFSSYVSPKIVEELIRNPEKLSLGGERRKVTILFSDMIGFTSLSERLPPEQVVALLNEYYMEMAGIIFRWDGTLDKFVGDEIMALWGAPADQPNHAELALRCALHMSDRLDELRSEWQAKGQEVLDCGIGLNSGEVLVGNVGLEGKKMDYTAIGNHVNIAARLEKLTRSYGTRILVAENTVAEIRPLLENGEIGHVELIPLESVKVKGKDEAVAIFAVRSAPMDEETAVAQGGRGR